MLNGRLRARKRAAMSRDSNLVSVVATGALYAVLVSLGMAVGLALVDTSLNYGGLAACTFGAYVTGRLCGGGT